MQRFSSFTLKYFSNPVKNMGMKATTSGGKLAPKQQNMHQLSKGSADLAI
jgi:hypothetical protein